MKAFLSVFVFVALLTLSGIAQACPVCFSAKGGTLNAFRFSTVFLTLLPLAAFFLFFQWYRRKAKEIDSQ